MRIHDWVFLFYAWLPSMLAFLMGKNDKENKTSKGKNEKKINEQRYLY